MDNIDISKYKNIINKNSSSNKESKLKKWLYSFVTRLLALLIIFLSLGVFFKSSSPLKDKVYNYVFKDDIHFTKIKELYNKYLGGILPLKKEANTEKVFNEKLTYTNSSKYHDGGLLEVSSNYLVPSLCEGMVVFIGDKENYGNTIIIEDLNGVEYWYGNIGSTSLKIYDYIEKGSYVGEVKDTNLYLVVSSDGKFLNYEDYLK